MVQGMGLSDKSPKKKESTTKPKETKKIPSRKKNQTKTKPSQRKQKDTPKKLQGNRGNKSSKGKIIIAFIVGVIGLIGVFIGYSYFSGGNDDVGTSIEDTYSSVPTHESAHDVDVIRSTASDHILHNPFSKAGLYEQMLSEGFNHELSSQVINELEVDWVEQAVLAGVRYMQYSAPEADESGLRDQLLYEGFTEEEVDEVVKELDIDELNQEYGPIEGDSGEPEIPESDKSDEE